VSPLLFKVDGSTIGAEDTVSPYSVTWNTVRLTDSSPRVKRDRPRRAGYDDIRRCGRFASSAAHTGRSVDAVLGDHCPPRHNIVTSISTTSTNELSSLHQRDHYQHQSP
jgi:hypothetical protein